MTWRPSAEDARHVSGVRDERRRCASRIWGACACVALCCWRTFCLGVLESATLNPWFLACWLMRHLAPRSINLNLGCDLMSVPMSGSFFTGYFGQVALLNTAVSAADVASLFARTSPQYIPSPPSPPPPSPSPPPPPPAPPPPLSYAQFPGCTTAVNGRACRALADLYVATQLNTGSWAAALLATPAPGANVGGWAFSTANYCAWSGVGCAVAATGVSCVSDTVPGCIMKSLCVATIRTRSWLEAGLTCCLLHTQVALELEPRGHHPCINRHHHFSNVAVRRGTWLRNVSVTRI